jgi:putative two-component system response regulator
MPLELADMQVALVDDNQTNLELLEQILSTAGYRNVRSIEDPHEIENELRWHPPDLVLLDLHMPARDGFEVLRALQPMVGPPDYLPVCVVTADTSVELKRRALQLGARDFLLKPVDAVEVMVRVRNLLEARYLARIRPREIEMSRLESLGRLVCFSGRHDPPQLFASTGTLAARLAGALELPEQTAARIGKAAIFHDVGNVGVASGILLKPGALTDAERAAAQRHTAIGADILGGGGETIATAAQIARSHHERWDGSGYPDGLTGEEIPVAARIVALAARYQGLIAGRPYRAPQGDAEARAAIIAVSGSRFDPLVVAAFTRLEDPSGAEQQPSAADANGAEAPLNAAGRAKGAPGSARA